MAQMIALLKKNSEFVNSKIDEEKIPTPSQLMQFISKLRNECRDCTVGLKLNDQVLQKIKDILSAGFGSIGWDVAKNTPKAGSAPPKIEIIASFLLQAMADINALAKPAAQKGKGGKGKEGKGKEGKGKDGKDGKGKTDKQTKKHKQSRDKGKGTGKGKADTQVGACLPMLRWVHAIVRAI
jgi:hypothetical protein